MYQVTLQVSARKTESHGFFANEDVATYKASTLSGFVTGDTAAQGVVSVVDIDMSTSVEEYQAAQQAVVELNEREEWANLYQKLSDTEKALMSKFAPASIQPE